MPTKPTDLVKPWGTAGNYPVGFYPALYPWVAPNPNGGNPYPWNSQPRIDEGDITAFAANGLTPQQPTPAEPLNRWNNTVYQNARWVELGSNANDADAHIVESDAFGVVSAVGFESEFAFQGLGATKAPLPQGAVIDSGMELELQGSADVTGTISSTITAGTFDTTTGGLVKTSDVTFYIDATPSGASGQMQWDGYRASVGTGSAAIPVSRPIFDYKATTTTTNAGTDIPGLDLSATVPDTRDVYITLEAHQEVDDAQACLLRIRATNGVDSVAQLKFGQDDAAVSQLPAATAGDRRPNSIRVRWRPTDDFPNPDNTSWTFFAQHGVNGLATLKTTAAVLKLDYR